MNYMVQMPLFFSKKVIDITDEIIELANQKINDINCYSVNTGTRSDKKVFIVHGHDSALLNDVARFISSCDLEPVILDEQPSKGQTIIEKIESNTDVNFAIVLYTPCDIGNEKTNDTMNLRARQNVIFEHGYTVAKLGRFSGHRKKSGLGQGIRMSRKYERNDKIALLYPANLLAGIVLI